jgi:hypothetical protein
MRPQVGEMPNELVVGFVVISSYGSLFDCSAHSLDLGIGPRMIGLGQPMLDPVFSTGADERMAAEPGSRA